MNYQLIITAIAAQIHSIWEGLAVKYNLNQDNWGIFKKNLNAAFEWPRRDVADRHAHH